MHTSYQRRRWKLGFFWKRGNGSTSTSTSKQASARRAAAGGGAVGREGGKDVVISRGLSRAFFFCMGVFYVSQQWEGGTSPVAGISFE